MLEHPCRTLFPKLFGEIPSQFETTRFKQVIAILVNGQFLPKHVLKFCQFTEIATGSLYVNFPE